MYIRISIAPNAYIIIILYLLCVKCIKSLNNRVWWKKKKIKKYLIWNNSLNNKQIKCYVPLVFNVILENYLNSNCLWIIKTNAL